MCTLKYMVYTKNKGRMEFTNNHNSKCKTCSDTQQLISYLHGHGFLCRYC